MRLPAVGVRARPRAVIGAATLAAALAVVVAWTSSGSAACAATGSPVTAAGTRGTATFYELGAIGNCSFPARPADDLYAALPTAEYDDAAACGGVLSVRGPRGTVRVQVVDRCPECEPGHVDLSRTAFARIADPVQGVVPVTYREVVDPRPARRLGFRVKEGSSASWLALLVTDHGNPLRRVEVRRDGRWVGLDRVAFNHWIADGGLGSGPFTVRVTDLRGNRAVARGVRLAPGRVQRGDVRLYGAGASRSRAAAPATTPARKAAAEKPAATPTPGRTRATSPSPAATRAPTATPTVAAAQATSAAPATAERCR